MNPAVYCRATELSRYLPSGCPCQYREDFIANIILHQQLHSRTHFDMTIGTFHHLTSCRNHALHTTRSSVKNLIQHQPESTNIRCWSISIFSGWCIWHLHSFQLACAGCWGCCFGCLWLCCGPVWLCNARLCSSLRCCFPGLACSELLPL